MINVKIIFKQKIDSLDKNIQNEIFKSNEIEEIEINDTENIGNLINKYCNIKNIKKKNLFLMKKDFKKINNNMTISKAKIENNETIFIFEENETNNKLVEENYK